MDKVTCSTCLACLRDLDEISDDENAYLIDPVLSCPPPPPNKHLPYKILKYNQSCYQNEEETLNSGIFCCDPECDSKWIIYHRLDKFFKSQSLESQFGTIRDCVFPIPHKMMNHPSDINKHALMRAYVFIEMYNIDRFRREFLNELYKFQEFYYNLVNEIKDKPFDKDIIMKERYNMRQFCDIDTGLDRHPFGELFTQGITDFEDHAINVFSSYIDDDAYDYIEYILGSRKEAKKYVINRASKKGLSNVDVALCTAWYFELKTNLSKISRKMLSALDTSLLELANVITIDPHNGKAKIAYGRCLIHKLMFDQGDEKVGLEAIRYMKEGGASSYSLASTLYRLGRFYFGKKMHNNVVRQCSIALDSIQKERSVRPFLYANLKALRGTAKYCVGKKETTTNFKKDMHYSIAKLDFDDAWQLLKTTGLNRQNKLLTKLLLKGQVATLGACIQLLSSS